jgi:hypothetical protein
MTCKYRTDNRLVCIMTLAVSVFHNSHYIKKSPVGVNWLIVYPQGLQSARLRLLGCMAHADPNEDKIASILIFHFAASFERLALCVNALFSLNLENTCQKDFHISIAHTLIRKTSVRHPPPSDSHVRSPDFLTSRFILQSFEKCSLSVTVGMKQWMYSLSYGGI